MTAPGLTAQVRDRGPADLSGTAGARWAHRPGLDGLRFVAVTLVIGFHADVTWLTNGHVGVDVFFVLSGYLVTTVLLQSGLDTFKYRTFYGRRVRRLLPAAVVAVVITCLGLLLYLPQLSREALVGDARAALLYVANWHFIGQSTDYFAADIDSSPFVHFWSLAIEEQFYLVYPLVLVGGHRLARRRFGDDIALRVVGLAVALLAVGSLGMQAYWSGTDATRAYFGTDARLYQLLIGAVAAIAVGARRRGGLRVAAALARPVAPLSLLVVVVLATSVVDLSVSLRGVAVAAAALALVVSIDVDPGSATNVVLGRRLPVYLGQISYMIYLAHWPIILLLRELFDLGPLALALWVALLSAALAALSFELLEQPIRRGQLVRHPGLSIGLGLGTSALAAVLVVPAILQADVKPSIRDTTTIVVSDAEPAPTPPPDEPASAASPTSAPIDAPPEPSELEVLLGQPVPADLDYDGASVGIAGLECPRGDASGCVVVPGPGLPSTGLPGSGLAVHLIGDSNASMLRPMLAELAAEQGWQLTESTFQGCPWQRDLATTSTPERCLELRPAWYERLSHEIGPDIVIVAGLDYEFETVPNRSTWVAVDDGAASPVAAPETTRALFVERTSAAIDELTASGATVVILEPIAYDQDLDPTSCLSGARTVGDCAFRRPELSFATRTYRGLASANDQVVSLDLDGLACPRSPVCLPLIDGRLVFRDPTHLSVDYTVALRGTFLELLATAGVIAG